ncbi:N-acetylmuramoyl-L-alanine amidase [soil metagenome]
MTGSARDYDFVASPNVEPRKGGKSPRFLILHYTGMKSAAAARSWLCDPRSKVSCHYLVDEEGAVTQMVDETMRAWHAGVSSWKGERDINSLSIGIEIHNPGHAAGYPDFPPLQMEAVARLCREIVQRHGIKPENVLAHSDVAPQRKIDPGEKFNWRFLHERGTGHWVEPIAISGVDGLGLGAQGKPVRDLQKMLKRYGYGIGADGVYDDLSLRCVAAFQRHFRPIRVDGVADTSTIETLRRLIGALPRAGGKS